MWLRQAEQQQAAAVLAQCQHLAPVGHQREDLATPDLAEMTGLVTGHRGTERLDARPQLRMGFEVDDACVIRRQFR